MRIRPWAALAALAAIVLSGCTLVSDTEPETTGSTQVVLVTHDSFHLPKKLIADFEATSGYTVVVRSSGDAGTLTNKLVLTKDSPTGDVAFGVDNTFASRALDNGVFAEYAATLPSGADAYRLPGADDRLTPIDVADVCVNVDTQWFADHDISPPVTLDDLTAAPYRDLFVTPAASTSSPGMGFLLTTIAAKGDGWQGYWHDLMANGVKITSGWSDAYFVDFTQGGESGDRPIVLSYDSSPAFTLAKDGKSSATRALLDTCFQQVEYAGVLAGAENPEGAQALVDFLLSPPVQEALPDNMYVFPVRDDVTLPADWARFARRPRDPYTVAPDDITENRDTWLRAWTDITSQ